MELNAVNKVHFLSSQVVENTVSKVAKNELYEWKLKEDNTNQTKSGTDTILTLRKPDKNRLKLTCKECIGKVCTNCTTQSQHCLCQSPFLKLENLSEARVIIIKDLPTGN